MKITLKHPRLSTFDKIWITMAFIGLAINIATDGISCLGAVGSGAGIGYLLCYLEARRQWRNINAVTISLSDGAIPHTEIVTATVTSADN